MIASQSQAEHLDCSKHNENLFLVGDNDEVNLWDLRATAKSMFTIRSGSNTQVEFSDVTSSQIITSKDTGVEYMSLNDLKQGETMESSISNVF